MLDKDEEEKLSSDYKLNYGRVFKNNQEVELPRHLLRSGKLIDGSFRTITPQQGHGVSFIPRPGIEIKFEDRF